MMSSTVCTSCPRVTGGLAETGLRGSEFYPVLPLPLLSQEAEGDGRRHSPEGQGGELVGVYT